MALCDGEKKRCQEPPPPSPMEFSGLGHLILIGRMPIIISEVNENANISLHKLYFIVNHTNINCLHFKSHNKVLI